MKAVILAMAVMTSATALAQPAKTKAAAAFKAGQALYLKEDYEGAAQQFAAAHDLDPDPVYLFNIAQAYRRAKKCKEAGDYYRRYLADAKKAPNADAVNESIAEVDACAKAQDEERAAAERAAAEAAAPSTPPPVAPPPPVETVAPAQPSSNKRFVGYIVTGGGVALAGLGVLFMTQVSGYEDDANAVCPNPCMAWDDAKTKRRAEIDDKAATREKLMVGSFIAGGAAIAAGVFLIATGGASAERGLAITPTRNGAMATLRF